MHADGRQVSGCQGLGIGGDMGKTFGVMGLYLGGGGGY